MSKARLIKKQDFVDRQEEKRQVARQRPTLKKKVNAVVEWLDSKREQRQDPRKAFEALFAQPQTQ